MSSETEQGGLSELRHDPLVVSLVVYVLVSIPLYLWLDGPVGRAGSTHPHVVIASLLLGGLLIVPMIFRWVKYSVGIGVADVDRTASAYGTDTEYSESDTGTGP